MSKVMSKVISSTKYEHTLKFVDFFNLILNVITKEKAHQVIESYDMLTGYGETALNETDAYYQRAVETVQELTYDHIKKKISRSTRMW